MIPGIFSSSSRFSQAFNQGLVEMLNHDSLGTLILGCAHASVNHLHFQMFLRPCGLPVMADHWQYNGGEKAYPAACERWNDYKQAWSYIDNLHQLQIPYNLIYLPGEVLIFPRKRQGEYPQAEWSGAFPGTRWVVVRLLSTDRPTTNWMQKILLKNLTSCAYSRKNM